MADGITKWFQGLDKTRKVTFGRLSSILGTSEINDTTWDELEEILYRADMGVETTEGVISRLKEITHREGLTKSAELNQYVKNELLKLLMPSKDPLDVFHVAKPFVILMVGVNGSGKTTTAAKLAKQYKDAGLKVLLGAADTFRAAAIEQLQAWGKRLDIPVIAGVEGGDSAAVAYDTVTAAIARNMDVVIIDTAGRLQTRYNLMEELKKVFRVTGKALPKAPHAVWIVLDATTGQNALLQARAFKDAVKVNGAIISKLDTSAKGGMLFAIGKELDLPIIYAGLGEKMDDLQRFDCEKFVDSIIGSES